MSVDMGPDDDAAVIAQSRVEPSRFEAIFDRHYDIIYGYLARRACREVAENIASETFCIAFDRRHRYNIHRTDARPWLFAIAMNLLRKHWRSERRWSRALVRLMASSGSGTPAHPGPELSDRYLEAALESALAALSRTDREVLLLYTWGELSYREIAEVLQAPVGTVQSRLHRARSQVRARLDHDQTTARRLSTERKRG